MSRDVATKSLHVTLAQGTHEYQDYFTEQYMQNGKNGRCTHPAISHHQLAFPLGYSITAVPETQNRAILPSF